MEIRIVKREGVRILFEDNQIIDCGVLSWRRKGCPYLDEKARAVCELVRLEDTINYPGRQWCPFTTKNGNQNPREGFEGTNCLGDFERLVS